jgi:hypothetical protein
VLSLSFSFAKYSLVLTKKSLIFLNENLFLSLAMKSIVVNYVNAGFKIMSWESLVDSGNNIYWTDIWIYQSAFFFVFLLLEILLRLCSLLGFKEWQILLEDSEQKRLPSIASRMNLIFIHILCIMGSSGWTISCVVWYEMPFLFLEQFVNIELER